jgi:IclR family acetate operon transcriptional repressor
MPEKRATQASVIQSLDRGLVILQAVALSKQPLSLGELAEMLEIDRSSAFRLAQTLRRRGFLSTPPGRKDYVLGSSMWTLSRQYDWSNMLVRVAHRELKALAAGTNETAHLAIREGKNALFIDSVDTTHVIAVAGQTGELVPLYCTAHGKALLADANERELKLTFGSGPLHKYTDSTIESISRLTQECVAIKDRGYATDEAEFRQGLRCVAAPIRTVDGGIVASIGISAPASRFLEEHYPEHAQEVVRIANNIGDLLESTMDKAEA